MLPTLHPIDPAALNPADHDALIAVFSAPDQLDALPLGLGAAARQALAVDAALGAQVGLVPAAGAPGGRLVLSPTGPLDRDHDDVRRFGDAAAVGLRRAVAAGARRPLLVVAEAPPGTVYQHAGLVSLLAALGALWQPLEAREALSEATAEPVTAVSFLADGALRGDPHTRAAEAAALEAGRRLARDLGGTEPERMSPPRMAALLTAAFDGTGVEVEVVDDVDALAAGYPLLMAVARASLGVPRHRPNVTRLRYVGPGPTTRTLLLAGKGLSYDTGGADLKTDGHMAGMSRDKGGAGGVAGFVLAAALLQVPGLEIVAELGNVRNSIGPDAFVADEIIRSHGGARVRVGNTDAEGRLVLADLLSHLRERALGAVAPHLFTVATLTGHAGRAVGPYTIVMDNGPAHDLAWSMAAAGDALGEGVEISRLRREDWAFIAPRSAADDLLSCNNAPSSATSRGHQFPMAFLIRAAGLEGHGAASAQPLAYSHVDIGGSGVEGGDWQHGRPTGAPILALAGRYLLG